MRRGTWANELSGPIDPLRNLFPNNKVDSDVTPNHVFDASTDITRRGGAAAPGRTTSRAVNGQQGDGGAAATGGEPPFRSSSEELVNNWKKLGSEGSFELDVVPAFERLTSDAISKTAFGSNYEQGKQLFECQAEQLQIVFQSYESAYIPGARYLPTKANKRLNYLDVEIRTILRGMIKKREEAIKLGGVCNHDLLSLLVDSNLRESQENTNMKNGGMSVDDIVEECKVFYFAGRETTSDLLIWTLVLLSMHHEWQERAREEVPMVLYEVLRLYPPFSMLIRHTDKATKLGEINLPQGVLVGLPVLSLHHDREIWGEDAEEFNPARFSGGVANAAKGKASFFTFGWGPRICIGQQFALLEAKIAVTMILQHFSFELSPTYVHSPYSLVTIQPQFGAPIVFHKL
ncbi:hypothetical protein Syun_027432 [Stephania yunnanensis]|uniref:Cytochrome P450 n=1 Tax=Stephania yunnanensis TaxID=152371 RepID=A0AAP0HQ75_9MAGN